MKEQGNQVKDAAVKIKNYIVEMPKQRKMIAGAVLLALVIAIAVFTVVLNRPQDEYVQLYSGLDAQENSDIYVELQKKGADAKLDASGNILVRESEYDIWLLQMASEGYPRSGMPYDTYASHAGMTTTESQNAVWETNDRQDRLQRTLKRIAGVTDAAVTLAMPEKTDYVWQQANSRETPTASVLLTLERGVTLNGTQVRAVKNLVAAGVPDLKAEDVKVIDAATGVELSVGDGTEGGAAGANGTLTNDQKLQLTQEVQQQLQNKVEYMLAARYGKDGVRAAANVTLNFDAMATETLTPTTHDDGSGYLTDFSTGGSVNGAGAPIAGGLVGEEDNTDIPDYVYNAGDADGGGTSYWGQKHYDYGYIKTQVEKGNAVIERATISVMVDETNMTPARIQDLIQLISNATDIAPQFISVSPYDAGALQTETTTPGTTTETTLPMWVFLAIGAALLLILLIIILLIARARRRKAEKLLEEREAAAAAEAEALFAAEHPHAQTEEERAEEESAELDEIEAYKRQLEDAARAEIDPKDEAIINEVRKFAKNNPEVTANLIRNWMREGD